MSFLMCAENFKKRKTRQLCAVFQTVDKDPGSHSRIRVFVHNKFCNIVEILTFLVEFTV